ncbi:hypothetical protein FHG87_020961 [Trinorchestia longiramus]|nr:hypothetical protein FHG87_020961 [Trinorchestia longiramus]
MFEDEHVIWRWSSTWSRGLQNAWSRWFCDLLPFVILESNHRFKFHFIWDANFELMKEELGSYNYEVLMSNKNAEECYMILEDKIAIATDHHIPRKRIMPTNNPPWFSQEIKRLINAKQHSYRRLKRYQTEPHRQEHIHACRAVKRTIKSTKRNKEITVAAQAKTNPKSFYKYVNDRRLKRDTIGPLIDSEGSTQTNNESKAKILNKGCDKSHMTYLELIYAKTT